MAEPRSGRVQQDDGTSKTFKMSLTKSQRDSMATMIYSDFCINGAQYCRRHLMIRCHLCQIEGTRQKEEADEERMRLGLRPAGDPHLDERVERWKNFTMEKLMESRLKLDHIRMMYGENHMDTHPEKYDEYVQGLKAGERVINESFLKENDEIFQKEGASQCCYWNCKTPDGIVDSDGKKKKLMKCAGCGIAKYCCKEHQKLDWFWEHKGECTKNIPNFIKEDIASDRLRNLAGDYSDYKW